MNVRDFEKIQELIAVAQKENAKATAQIELIEDEWKKKYGTNDVETIKKMLVKLGEEEESVLAKIEKIEKQLLNLCDWEKLEEELM